MDHLRHGPVELFEVGMLSAALRHEVLRCTVTDDGRPDLWSPTTALVRGEQAHLVVAHPLAAVVEPWIDEIMRDPVADLDCHPRLAGPWVSVPFLLVQLLAHVGEIELDRVAVGLRREAGPLVRGIRLPWPLPNAVVGMVVGLCVEFGIATWDGDLEELGLARITALGLWAQLALRAHVDGEVPPGHRGGIPGGEPAAVLMSVRHVWPRRGVSAPGASHRRGSVGFDHMRPETSAAQAAGYADPATGALTPPIHLSTTFARDADGVLVGGHEYIRADNPTFEQPERLLAELEGGAAALLFASGNAAASALFCALLPGDHVVAPRIMYWGLRKWLAEFAVSWGIDVTHVDTTDVEAIRAAMRPGDTRLVWIETPANPTWEITDIAAAAEVAHAGHALLAVDSTVATPVHTRPLALGADLVVHAATKFLNGHGDVLAGAVVAAVDGPFVQRVRAWRRGAGSVPGSVEAWLLLRGMRTLYPRVRQSSASALAIAERFADDARVDAVLYPGLASHPGHDVARRQMADGFSGMLSLRVGGGAAAAAATLSRLEVFTRATSLGGTESLAEHRAPAEGPSTPVPADLLRFSIGLEHPDDLIADLDRALDHGVEGEPAPVPVNDTFGALRRTVIARGGDLVRTDDGTGPDGVVVAVGSPGAVEPVRDQLDLPRTTATTVAGVLAEVVDPSVTAHGGAVVLVEEADGVVRVRLEGRCQGCAMAQVTVRQGVEPLLRRHVAGVRAVVDVTDHTAGTDPYYPPTKR